MANIRNVKDMTLLKYAIFYDKLQASFCGKGYRLSEGAQISEIENRYLKIWFYARNKVADY